jgi:hypothetical protein
MRVNKEFEKVKDYKDEYLLSYPVEISAVICAKSISIKEEAPVVVGIINRSNRAVGVNANFSRLLRVKLEHLDGPSGISFKINKLVD